MPWGSLTESKKKEIIVPVRFVDLAGRDLHVHKFCTNILPGNAAYITTSDYVALQVFNSGGYDSTRKTGYITVPPTITITSPNGGEIWQRGTTQTTWTYTGTPGTAVKLILLKAGAEVGTIVGGVSIGTGGTGSYTWAINPSGSTGGDYSVSVQSISQPTIKDTSNGYFTLIPAGTITSSISVTAPNGGEIWKRGTIQTVKWSFIGNPGPYVKIELLQGGTPVGTATYSTSIGSGGTRSYPWTISSTRAPGTNYSIRVTSVSQPSLSDTSNGDFTITA